jgi:hypothetical protein
MSELDDETKARIEAEERYRAELRIIADRKARASEPTQSFKLTSQKNPPGCMAWIGGSILVLILFGIIGSLFPRAQTPTSTGQVEDTYDTFAFAVQCERIIKDKLKAPSTAIFPNAYEEQQQITKPDSGYYWEGTVDAENSFGAMLRNKFKCTYTRSTGKVRAVLLQ